MIACVIAAISYGFYSAMSKKMRYDTEILLFFAFASSTILCFAVAAMRGELTIPTVFTGTGYLIFGLFTNGIAYLLWMVALGNGNTALISNLGIFNACCFAWAYSCISGRRDYAVLCGRPVHHTVRNYITGGIQQRKIKEDG